MTSVSGEESASNVKLPLGLPSIDSKSESGSTPNLDVGSGQTISLDSLGPMVVNVDGTFSRITNWEEMTEPEKKNMLRLIGKRNQKRLEVLRQQELSDVLT